jgi:hypothetical protein
LPRTALVALLALATAAVAPTPSTASDPAAIDLRIAFHATPTAVPKVHTLTCNPTGGTVPDPATACRRLLTLGAAAFAPTPRGQMCTQIAGGPMTALVTGSLHGHRIWTRLTQRDGCAIARWNRVSFLLPRWKSGSPIGR